MVKTQIAIEKSLAKRLKAKALTPRESYSEIIGRLLSKQLGEGGDD